MLILASNSPRRKQLLSLGGWNFSVLAPQVDETVLPGEDPQDYVLRLAQAKAHAAWAVLDGRGMDPALLEEAVILAADTAVIDPDETGAGSRILGKPADPGQAVAMLRRLGGRTHEVFSGLAVLRVSDGRLLKEMVASEVPMRSYSDLEIQAYVATGDPLDKAGAYAIQHPTFHPVQNLQGCYANVMGLPVCHVSRMLAEVGCPSQADIAKECQQVLDFPCRIYRQSLQTPQDVGSSGEKRSLL
jgi:MAF protein